MSSEVDDRARIKHLTPMIAFQSSTHWCLIRYRVIKSCFYALNHVCFQVGIKHMTTRKIYTVERYLKENRSKANFLESKDVKVKYIETLLLAKSSNVVAQNQHKFIYITFCMFQQRRINDFVIMHYYDLTCNFSV